VDRQVRVAAAHDEPIAGRKRGQGASDEQVRPFVQAEVVKVDSALQ
jgi:hypothetical protein